MKNVGTYAPFPQNTSAWIQPKIIGYADSILSKNGNVITLPDTSNYIPGGWVFTYLWDGYYTGTPCTRLHRIIAVKGNQVALDSAPDARANGAAWVREGFRAANAVEGATRFSVTAPVRPGLYRISGGPRRGNEIVGEVRYIDSSGKLDRPLRMSYTNALAAYLPMTQNVELRDFSILQPVNQQSRPTFFENARDLRLERMRIEGHLDLTLCSRCTIRDCEISGTIVLNGSQDITIERTRCTNVYIEEECSDIDFIDVIASGSPTAAYNCPEGSPSERLRFTRCVAENCADMPWRLWGRENSLRDCRIQYANGAVASYFDGDRLTIDGLTSNIPVVIKSGSAVSLTSIKAPLILGWDGTPANQPTGTCVDCKPDVSKLTAATLSQWSIYASSQSSS